MRILTAEQMKACDEATFRDLGVPARAVMEVAGRSLADAALRVIPEGFQKQGFLVLAGAGNNGGDACVVARLLHQLGHAVHLVSLLPPEKLQGEARSCFESYRLAGGTVRPLGDFLSGTLNSGVIVDGLFGTGLSRPPDGDFSRAIQEANLRRSSGKSYTLAIDLPSGVHANSGKVLGDAIVADSTISLQTLKPCHVLNPAHERCGDIYVSDIGVFVPQTSSSEPIRILLQSESLKSFLLPLRESSSVHKGKRGHVLILGGSQGKSGAPQLSARGALRAGCGLATVLTPGPGGEYSPEQLLEVMTSGLSESLSEEELGLKLREEMLGKKAVVIGPGLGDSPRARTILRLALGLLKELAIPFVLDADGLNLLALEENPKDLLPALGVLTPHPGEMSRLCKISIAEVEASRFEVAESLAKRLDAMVVLKGAMSVVASPQGCTAVSPHAHANLATAGSGDVLSGIIAGYLAQGLEVAAATQLAVYLHAEAGAVLEAAGPGKGVGALAHEFADLQPEVADFLLTHEERSGSEFLRFCLPARLLCESDGDELSGRMWN